MSDLKAFHPDRPAAVSASAPPVTLRGTRSTVAVAEVTAERDLDAELPLPLHLLAEPGAVRVQLRTMLRRVAMGAGLARRADLAAVVRALPGMPALVTSPAGGTFVVGGDAWLGVAAIGTPPPGDALALDWMLGALRDWFAARLGPAGVALEVGRVEGAWCPGFSDLGSGGRKLVGLGFRVTRDWVVMRGVMAVRPLDAADLSLLQAVHAFIGVSVVPQACTSLVELTGDGGWTVERAIALLSGDDAPAIRG